MHILLCLCKLQPLKKLPLKHGKYNFINTKSNHFMKKDSFFCMQETNYNLHSVTIKKYQLLLLLQLHKASCGLYNRD